MLFQVAQGWSSAQHLNKCFHNLSCIDPSFWPNTHDASCILSGWEPIMLLGTPNVASLVHGTGTFGRYALCMLSNALSYGWMTSSTKHVFVHVDFCRDISWLRGCKSGCRLRWLYSERGCLGSTDRLSRLRSLSKSEESKLFADFSGGKFGKLDAGNVHVVRISHKFLAPASFCRHEFGPIPAWYTFSWVRC